MSEGKDENEIGQQSYTIVFKDETIIIDDPLMLSQVSPYFKMLYQKNPLKVVIDDTNYSNHVFHLLLDGCHNKLTHFYFDYIFELYSMAKDWMVQSLITRCEGYIKAQGIQEQSVEVIVENLQKINPRKTNENDRIAIKNAAASYEKILTDPNHLIYLVNPNIIIQFVKLAENTDYNQELFAIMVSQLYNMDKDKAIFLYKNYQWNLLSEEQMKGYFSGFQITQEPKQTKSPEKTKQNHHHHVKLPATEQISVTTEPTASTSRSKSKEVKNITKAKVLQALNMQKTVKVVPPLNKSKNIQVLNRPIHRRTQSSMPIPSPTTVSSLKAQPLLNPNDVDYRRKLVMRLNDEQFFDQMMDRCNTMTLDKAFEPLAKGYFEASRAIVWTYDFKEKFFFSRAKNHRINANTPLFEQISSQKSVLTLPDIGDEEQAKQVFSEPTDHQLFIPLYINTGLTIAILQVTREESLPQFAPSDEEKAAFFMRKFEIYGGAFFGPPMKLMMASNIAQISSPVKTVENIIETLQRVIKSKTIEFWYYDNRADEYAKFMNENSNFTLLYRCSIGIVANCLKKCQDVNLPKCGNHPNYNERADGDPMTPILVSTMQFDGRTWAMVMRERLDYDFFTPYDSQLTSSLMPFIIRAIAFSTGFSATPTNNDNNNDIIITRLLDAASDVASTLDLRDLIVRIEECSASLLNCQTAKCFLSDTQKGEFHCDFGDDITEYRAFHITEGLAGYIYNSRMTATVDDPSKNEYFTHDFDAGSLETVNNLIAFPVSGQGGIVLAVIIGFNKKSAFNDTDITTAQSFSNICGVALQNAINHHRSISITSMLSEMNQEITLDGGDLKIADVQRLLDAMSSKAMKFTSSASSALFLAMPAVSGLDVSLFKESGGDGNQFYEFAREAISKEGYSVQVNDLPVDPDAVIEDVKTSSRSYVSTKSTATARSIIKPLKTVVIGSPIFDEDRPVGIFIFSALSAATTEEIQMIKTFFAISLSTFGPQQVKSLSEMWDKKMHLRRYIKDEDDSPAVPQSLLISVKEIDYAATDTIDDAFKIVVSGFYHLGLISQYQIPVSRLIMLVLEVSTRYPEGFRSFRHTLDTFKYVVRALKLEEFAAVPKQKSLSMLLAALACELDRPDFEALGDIALEALAECSGICVDSGCNSLTEIMRAEECNIVQNIEDDELKTVWKDCFRFAHATDMSRHFEMMDALAAAVEEEDGFDITKENHMMAMLDALMKCADLHDVILPLEEMEKKKHEFAADFFMFGEILRCKGMVFNGDASRATIDKEESNIGFFTYICLPLFAAVGRAIAGIEPDVDNLLAAIAHFREQIELAAEQKEKVANETQNKEETKPEESQNKEAEKKQEESKESNQEESKENEQKPTDEEAKEKTEEKQEGNKETENKEENNQENQQEVNKETEDKAGNKENDQMNQQEEKKENGDENKEEKNENDQNANNEEKKENNENQQEEKKDKQENEQIQKTGSKVNFKKESSEEQMELKKVATKGNFASTSYEAFIE